MRICQRAAGFYLLTTFLFFCFVPFSSSGSDAVEFVPVPASDSDTARSEVRFLDDIIIVSQQGTDPKVNEEWINAVLAAKTLLLRANPNIWRSISKSQEGIPLTIIMGKRSWKQFTGFYDVDLEKHVIFINEEPSKEPFFHFTHLADGGFTKTIRLYAVLHEMAHAYDTSSEFAPSTELKNAIRICRHPELDPDICAVAGKAEDKNFVFHDPLLGHRIYFKGIFREAPPTVYPLYLCDYRPAEDFAESFALFVMWPHALQECCGMRFGMLRQRFGMVYEDMAEMSLKISARLLRERIKRDNIDDDSAICRKDDSGW